MCDTFQTLKYLIFFQTDDWKTTTGIRNFLIFEVLTALLLLPFLIAAIADIAESDE